MDRDSGDAVPGRSESEVAATEVPPGGASADASPEGTGRTWRGLSEMVAEGRWGTLADLLVTLASDPSTLEIAEEALGQLIGRGRIVSLAGALQTRERLPLLLRLVEAEVGVRLWDVHAYELEALAREVDHTGRSDWRLWATSLIAEHHLSWGDLSAFTIASSAVAATDLDDDRPFALLGRAKAHRILAVGGLYLSGGSEAAPADIAMAETVALFEAAGGPDEVLATRALCSFVRAMVRRESAIEQLVVTERVVHEASTLESDRLGDYTVILAWIGALAWELDAVRAALAAFDADASLRPAYLDAMRDAVGLVVDIIEHNQEPAELGARLRHVGAGVHGSTVLMIGIRNYLAGLFADEGLPHLAREAAPELEDLAGRMARLTTADVRTLQARVHILEKPGTDSVEAFEAALDEFARSSTLRPTAVVALRGALTCTRVGLEDEARRLAARGIADLPAPAERTRWESHYAASVEHLLR